MNFLASLVILLLSSSVFAMSCPNFSGRFELVDPNTKMKLESVQVKCKSVTFSYNYYTQGTILGKSYVLDGVRKKTGDNEELIVYETAAFKNMQIVSTVEFFDKKTRVITTAKVSYSFDAHRDLVMHVDYLRDGRVYGTQDANYKRIN